MIYRKDLPMNALKFGLILIFFTSLPALADDSYTPLEIYKPLDAVLAQGAPGLDKDFDYYNLAHMRKAFFVCGATGFAFGECPKVRNWCMTKRHLLDCNKRGCTSKCPGYHP
jgi:hypothetical protein